MACGEKYKRFSKGPQQTTELAVYLCEKERAVTSRSIMSLGKGTSGFSPVSTIGMLAFFISFSTNPAR